MENGDKQTHDRKIVHIVYIALDGILALSFAHLSDSSLLHSFVGFALRVLYLNAVAIGKKKRTRKNLHAMKLL